MATVEWTTCIQTNAKRYADKTMPKCPWIILYLEFSHLSIHIIIQDIWIRNTSFRLQGASDFMSGKKTPLLTKNCISKILLQHGGSEPISILYAGIIIKIFKTRVILAYVTIGILQGTIVLLSIFSYIHDKNINQQCKTRVNTLAPPTNFLIKMIG